MRPGTRMTTVLVLVAFAAAYVLIATERVHRVTAALGGAAAMVVLGVVDTRSRSSASARAWTGTSSSCCSG